MLAYVLALVVGFASFALYMAAFFFPEVHRKNDFIWSGVGLFYALVLWVCAGRITGGVLLGQVASVALLGWFGWQTLTLRRSLLPPEQRTAVPSQGELSETLKTLSPGGGLQRISEPVTGLFKNRFGKKTPEAQKTQTPIDTKASSPDLATQTAPAEVKDTTAPAEVTEVTAPTTAPKTTEAEPAVGETEKSESLEPVRPNPPDPELVEAAKNSAPSDEEVSERTETLSEEIPPEAELAPPAEAIGLGDTEDRRTES